MGCYKFLNAVLRSFMMPFFLALCDKKQLSYLLFHRIVRAIPEIFKGGV